MNRVKWLAIGIASMVFAASAPASAHGPTVEITPAGFEPQLLNLFEGTTVHFTNVIGAAEAMAEGSSDGVVVTDLAGTFKSPPITAAGDGWHYTFEQIGVHELRIEQRPEAKMRIVIVKKRVP